MNTYVVVIKPVRLHYALLFSSDCFSLLFSPQKHACLRPFKRQNRLEKQRDGKTAPGLSGIPRQTLDTFYRAAPVPAAMHICLASAHYR